MSLSEFNLYKVATEDNLARVLLHSPYARPLINGRNLVIVHSLEDTLNSVFLLLIFFIGN